MRSPWSIFAKIFMSERDGFRYKKAAGVGSACGFRFNKKPRLQGGAKTQPPCYGRGRCLRYRKPRRLSFSGRLAGCCFGTDKTKAGTASPASAFDSQELTEKLVGFFKAVPFRFSYVSSGCAKGADRLPCTLLNHTASNFVRRVIRSFLGAVKCAHALPLDDRPRSESTPARPEGGGARP